MAEQNKTTSAGGSRATALTQELMGQAVKAQAGDAMTGQRRVNDPFQTRLDKQNNIFQTKQGFRRRHPNSVLHNYTTIYSTTDSASTVVEAALEHEHVRVDIPKDNRPSSIATGMTTMYHIDDVAFKNFANSRTKLNRMHLVGV